MAATQPQPRRTPDLSALLTDSERRWSGRGQRFVEEAPRYFERARFTAMPKQGGAA